MAAFSALTHARYADADAILEALVRALRATDKESAEYYGDLVDVGLGDTPARETWRKLMTFVNYFPGRGTFREQAYLEGKAEGKEDGIAEGLVKGRAEALLRFLELRGIPISDSTRERIADCTDLDILGRWGDRSATVDDANDLFTEEPEPGADRLR
ncbi:hypothetical protein ACFQ0X_21605 [Streptomyces rectiviolaceus]|uniref:Uncharacterized protein n=1 Tax=Streptomyces rectiviolaceus TaxID=332591 RepID=A0ABP6MWG3_9ACTN